MKTEVQPPPAPPSAVRVVLSGAVGLALGLVLVAWSMGTQRPIGDPDEVATAPSAEPELGSRDSESDSESDVGSRESESDVGSRESESDVGSRESESDVGSRESESEAEVEPAAEEPATPSVPATTAAGTPGSTTFERGRVAFLRCGEPNVRCGRDRDFEEAAWAIFAELPSCQPLAGRTGTADVRVHRTNAGTELRFRDWGESPLPIGPMQGCLESAGLDDLPIAVEGSPLIVSFRFQLR